MIASWVAAAVVAAATNSYPANAITIHRAEVPPVIDGKLGDPVWRDAYPISDFHQQGPEYRAPPLKRPAYM
ncbi:MAG: hypothetical protein ACREQZ_02280 [Woeseiaceae bacterium]